MTRQARSVPVLGLQRQIRLELARRGAESQSLSLKQVESINLLLDLPAQLESVVYQCRHTSTLSRGSPE